jgi:MFS family permease
VTALALPEAFRYRDFRLAQAGRLLTTLGTQMQSVAVGWQVYTLTGKTLDLGYVGLAQFLPAFVLSLVAGQVADRFDRKRIVLVCQLTFAACAFALFALSSLHVRAVGPIYAVLVVFGATRAFAGPAAQSLLPSLVPPIHFAKAVASASSVYEIASIAGPALGGLVYGAAKSASAVYLTTGVFCVAAASMTAQVQVQSTGGDGRAVTLARVFDGVRYVWNEKLILGAISLDLFAVLLGGAVALLPAIAKDVLHTGPWGLGLLRSAPAVGALLVAILLSYRPLKHGVGAKMFLCVALFGAATVGFGLSTSFALSLFLLAVIGAADMVSVVIRLTLVQVRTPESMRGRVSAVNLVFVGASNELGEFESGVTAALFGLVPAVVVGGLGTMVVVGLWALLFPELRKADTLDLEPKAA